MPDVFLREHLFCSDFNLFFMIWGVKISMVPPPLIVTAIDVYNSVSTSLRGFCAKKEAILGIAEG
jgi:hypothetical protein